MCQAALANTSPLLSPDNRPGPGVCTSHTSHTLAGTLVYSVPPYHTLRFKIKWKMAAKFMKCDTFIQMVIFKQIFHFCIFRRNFNCHTSPTSMPNFCIGFWNDIGDKKSEKNHFRVLPISRENYPCRPVFEGFELNRKTSPPFLNE